MLREDYRGFDLEGVPLLDRSKSLAQFLHFVFLDEDLPSLEGDDGEEICPSWDEDSTVFHR